MIVCVRVPKEQQRFISKYSLHLVMPVVLIGYYLNNYQPFCAFGEANPLTNMCLCPQDKQTYLSNCPWPCIQQFAYLGV